MSEKKSQNKRKCGKLLTNTALYESADWHIKSATNVADILLSKARQNLKSKARFITHLQVRLFKRSLTIGHLFR